MTMLSPMNHREIEYRSKKLWDEEHLDLKSIYDMFEAQSSKEIMRWLDDTTDRVIQEDLLLDYGQDCIRMYLMFENTPKEDDPYLDTWVECSLEGVYKFLGKYRRMIMTAMWANENGKYTDQQELTEKCKEALALIQNMKKDCLMYMDKKNTMPNRHNAVSVLMEGMKTIQKSLRVGEMIVQAHDHDIDTAVPHGEQKDTTAEVDEKPYQKNDTLVILLKEFIIMMTPFAPHLSEDLWQQVRQAEDSKSVLMSTWKLTEEYIEVSQVPNRQLVIPVQVNSRTRKHLTIEAGASHETVEESAKKLVESYINGKEIRCIYIQDKLINFIYQTDEK